MENENKNIDKIIDRLQNGVREIFEGDNFKHYLEVMAKFHTFSSYNWQLIYEQCPNATKLAGYVQWKRDFNRHVKKGEKAIRILAPRFGAGGMRGFKEVCIFDISQTEGDPLPQNGIELKILEGNYESYEILFNALTKISPLPIEFGKLKAGVRGTCYIGRKIVISVGMSQLQNTKTLIHEIAHELLHNGTDKNRNTKEVEAESVAYAVCSYFNLDTSEYSFNYVADWSEDKQLDILRSSLETITEAANRIINDVLEYLGEDIEDIDFDIEDDEQRGKELYELGMSYYKEKNYESAVEYFKQAVNLNNNNALRLLAWCYYSGLGVDVSMHQAYDLYMRLSNDDNGYAYFMLGEICCSNIEGNIDYNEAVYWYKKSAELGYRSAYYQLGDCYKYGSGVKADSEKSQEYYIEAFLAGDEDAIEEIDSDLIYKKGYSIYRKRKYAESLRYLKIAAELGNVEANYLLGCFYDFGYGVKINYEKAYDYYLCAAENGHAHAQYDVGFAFRYARGIERNLEKAIYWFKKSAALECDAGQYELANCYWHGIGVEEDRRLATEYYLKAYEQGYDKAGYRLVRCYYYGLDIDKNLVEEFIDNYVCFGGDNDKEFLFYLGEMYYEGNLVEQDYKRAVECFEEAIDIDYNSYYHLAECYFYGLGTERNLAKAFEYYQEASYNPNIYKEKASEKMYALLLKGYWKDEIDDDVFESIAYDAEKGDCKAQFILGNCYYNGYGIDVDYAEALSWREKAAEAGDAQTQFLVAQQYFSGIGTLIDVEKAKHWYTLSAENGNVEAQFELAKLLENGKDRVKKNLAGAFYWYKKAAEADDIYAILKVGQMYDAGIGIGKNIEKALYWYEKAAAKNSIDAIYYLANMSLYIHRDISKCIAGYEKILKLTQNKKMKGLVLTQLGIFYSQGIGVKKDTYKAMYYYRDAVANDSAEAAYLLGNFYLQQKDYGAAKRAVEVFMLGADCGSIACRKKLAELYINGIVVQKSKNNAIRWLAEAAKSGDVEAEIKMLELLQSDDESQHGEEKASEEKADGLNSNLADKLADIFS